MENQDLADAIRTVIRDAGESANALGIASKVDRGIITRFLNGERTITLDTAQRLLDALGCIVDVRRPESVKELIAVKRKRKRS